MFALKFSLFQVSLLWVQLKNWKWLLGFLVSSMKCGILHNTFKLKNLQTFPGLSLQHSEWYILYCTDSPDPLQSRQGYKQVTEQEENCTRENRGVIRERVTKHWNRLLREVVEWPSLDGLKMCVHSTWGHGLVTNMELVLGWWLDLIISKSFPGFTILWFWDPA